VDLRAELQSTLGNTHVIEQELGGGGMSRVFIATQTALGRKVVIKLLAPELAHSVSGARFNREIQLSAQLHHPRIVPLLLTGSTADGLPYYTMPYIDGESLRSRLQRSGALPLKDVITTLRDVTSALAYAHGRGIVHRDIKPENIMFDHDAAMVMDFGVAKALADSSIERISGPRTTAGMAVGTPAYMSPEQAAGDPSTDHRADIYTLGIVAYEMLTGHAPFEGLPFHKLLAAHAAESPQDVAKHRPETPAPLAALVMECLAKSPSDRPQTALGVLEVLEALDPLDAVDDSPGDLLTSPPRRSGPLAWTGAALIVALIVAGGFAIAYCGGGRGA
jgi:serine/threonine protein kinase